MNIIFLSISTAISDLDNRGIYPDLMRYFSNQGHQVTIVCPFERRTKQSTQVKVKGNVTTLGVKTFNITKSNFVEKGIATLLIEYQFEKAIEKHLSNKEFDLILYATPPITFNSLIKKIKIKHKSKTYLMLKDIFPQNAIDLGMMKKNSFLHRYFERKEKDLYEISDFIGCMSPANIDYLLKHNPELNPRKFGLCPNAIEIKDRNPENKLAILNKYGIPSDVTIFLYGGNLGAPQGITNLIKVLEMNINRKDCFFLIIGSGQKAHLIVDFIQKGEPNNILYIPMLDRKEYDDIEACVDIGMIFLDHKFTIPNFPSRMLSYLESKLPLLIATDNNSDIGEIAQKNKFGTWSLSCDIDDICSKVDFFVNNVEVRKIMGENGYKFLKENYEVSIAYSSIFKILV